MNEIVGPQQVSHDAIIGYSFTPQQYLSYTWTAIGGVILAGQTLPAVIVQWTNAGTNQLQIQFTSTEGYIDNVVVDVDTSAQGGNPIPNQG